MYNLHQTASIKALDSDCTDRHSRWQELIFCDLFPSCAVPQSKQAWHSLSLSLILLLPTCHHLFFDEGGVQSAPWICWLCHRTSLSARHQDHVTALRTAARTHLLLHARATPPCNYARNGWGFGVFLGKQPQQQQKLLLQNLEWHSLEEDKP